MGTFPDAGPVARAQHWPMTNDRAPSSQTQQPVPGPSAWPSGGNLRFFEEQHVRAGWTPVRHVFGAAVSSRKRKEMGPDCSAPDSVGRRPVNRAIAEFWLETFEKQSRRSTKEELYGCT